MSRVVLNMGRVHGKGFLIVTGNKRNVIELNGNLIRDLPVHGQPEVKEVLFTRPPDVRISFPNDIVGKLTELADLPIDYQKAILQLLLAQKGVQPSIEELTLITAELPELKAAAQQLIPNFV